jgi:hypothetical protein
MRTLAALLVGAFFATACAGSGDTSQTKPTATSPVTLAPTLTPSPTPVLATPSGPSADNSSFKFTKIAGGLQSPVYVTGAGDGSGRLFIVEQVGRIRVVKDGVLLTKPFLDIRSLVASGGERGLLSVAFHPQSRQTESSSWTARAPRKRRQTSATRSSPATGPRLPTRTWPIHLQGRRC